MAAIGDPAHKRETLGDKVRGRHCGLICIGALQSLSLNTGTAPRTMVARRACASSTMLQLFCCMKRADTNACCSNVGCYSTMLQHGT